MDSQKLYKLAEFMFSQMRRRSRNIQNIYGTEQLLLKEKARLVQALKVRLKSTQYHQITSHSIDIRIPHLQIVMVKWLREKKRMGVSYRDFEHSDRLNRVKFDHCWANFNTTLKFRKNFTAQSWRENAVSKLEIVQFCLKEGLKIFTPIFLI